VIKLSADQHLNLLGLGAHFRVYTEFSCRRWLIGKRENLIYFWRLSSSFFGSDTGAVERINISLGGDYPVGSLTILSAGSSIYVIVIQPAVDNNAAAEGNQGKEEHFLIFDFLFKRGVCWGWKFHFDLVLFAQAGFSLDLIPTTPPSTNTKLSVTSFRSTRRSKRSFPLPARRHL
jgi:hypothetical protein